MQFFFYFFFVDRRIYNVMGFCKSCILIVLYGVLYEVKVKGRTVNTGLGGGGGNIYLIHMWSVKNLLSSCRMSFVG